ncbi:hypothetical protein ATANTOWER_013688 [Ataeniobius toweri]|uniref:Uncharacterized protein n=1 Tax=Ataeniobius toweri TaxID=208326 RepID=A0ABU7CGF6_9TELE|nr:hypothetical protein [Ataeniobius toweri]
MQQYRWQQTDPQHHAATTILPLLYSWYIVLSLKSFTLILPNIPFVIVTKNSIFVSLDHKTLLHKTFGSLQISGKPERVRFGAGASFLISTLWMLDWFHFKQYYSYCSICQYIVIWALVIPCSFLSSGGDSLGQMVGTWTQPDISVEQ